MSPQTHFVLGSLVLVGLVTLGAILAERERADRPGAGAVAAGPAGPAITWEEVEVTDERVKRGEALFTSLGCNACHSVDGSMRVGPSMAGLYGKEEKMTDGSVVTVDESYLVESIYRPAARIVAGFAPTMPTYAGRIEGEDMNAMLAYIKSLE
jgi:cytochrome c2